MASKRIALVGLDAELAMLLTDVLADEGYVADTISADSSESHHPGESRPDLIIFATSVSPERLDFLDRLRTTPETNAIPVIVLATLSSMWKQAQASGNVYAVLPAPFEIDQLMETVRHALAQEPFEARVQLQPTEPDLQVLEAASALLRAERDLMLDWVQQVRTVEPFASQPGISTREFLNSLPRILHALVLVLRQQTPVDVLTQDSEMQERIREHARTRREQGVAAAAVVREYQVLRQVISRRLRRDLPADYLPEVVDQLHYLLDEAIRITVTESLRLAEEGPAPGSDPR
jgi:CheY-like chemotaxis protein